MRKGTSSAVRSGVHENMKSEVKNGDVFILVGSNHRLMKLLLCGRRRHGDVCKNAWRSTASNCRSTI